MYKDSISVGTLLKDTVATSFTQVNLPPGIYIAEEADSVNWIRLGIIRDTIDISEPRSRDTIQLSTDQSHTVNFINFHPNKVIIRNLKDEDGNPLTTNDQIFKRWNLSLYKGLAPGWGLVDSVISFDSLTVENIGQGTFTAIASDSSGWKHIGIIYNGNLNPTPNVKYYQFITGEGKTYRIDFINFPCGTIRVAKYLDPDGDFFTVGGRSLLNWGLKLYRINGADTVIVDSVNNGTGFTKNELPIGIYLAVEADSASPPWRHLGTLLRRGLLEPEGFHGTQNYIPINLNVGDDITVSFVNFNKNRVKIWRGSISNCEWSDAYNWSPPGVPIRGDSIVVPDTARCRLLIPAGSQVGTLVVAPYESVFVSSGSFMSTGDVTINGIMIADTVESSSFSVGGNWLTNKFVAGKSTVTFSGTRPQTIDGNNLKFYNLSIDDGSSHVINILNNVEVENILHLGGYIDVGTNTVFVLNNNPNAVTGSGIVTNGTIGRVIQSGAINAYRFESDSTYLNPDIEGIILYSTHAEKI